MKKFGLFFLLLSTLVLSVKCTKQSGGDDNIENPTSSSILKVTVNPAVVVLPEVVTIDESRNIVYLRISGSYNIKALAPEITVSNGGTVSPASGSVHNFEEPLKYTVYGSDGGKKEYTFIATQTKGTVNTKMPNNSTAEKEFNAYTEYCAMNLTSGMGLYLGGCSLPPAVDKDVLFLNLKGKSTGMNLVGTYDMSNSAVVSGYTLVSGSLSTLSKYENMAGGTLEITKHDQGRGLISGKFTNVTFNSNPGVPQQNNVVTLSGEFKNVPL